MRAAVIGVVYVGCSSVPAFVKAITGSRRVLSVPALL
jgi:hypothetical protein